MLPLWSGGGRLFDISSSIHRLKQQPLLCRVQYYSKLEIPKHLLDIAFARSSGPGGQNVNKVNTKADIRFKVSEADWIPPDVRTRLRAKYANKINGDDELVITSQKFRSQEQNVKDAIAKLSEILDDAAYEPPARIETDKPEYADRTRLIEKKQRSAIKKSRTQKIDYD